MQKNNSDFSYNENPQHYYFRDVNYAFIVLQNYLNNYCFGLSAHELTNIFYIDPLQQNMYYFNSNKYECINLREFDYILKRNYYCSNNIDIKKIYNALFDFLTEQAKNNPTYPLYMRFMHVKKNSHIPTKMPPNKFLIKKDGIICVSASPFLSKEGIALTKSALTHFLETTLCYTYSQRQIYKIWGLIKKCKYIPDLPDKMQRERLYDASGNYVKFVNGNIIHEKNTDAADDYYNFNKLPYDFLKEDYYFSEAILNALYNITNKKISAFKHLARLVASAYSDAALLKSATIIVTTTNNHNSVTSLINKLFNNQNVSLPKEWYINPTLFYEKYINHNFTNTPIFFIQEYLPDNCDNLRNLVGAKTFRLKIKDYGDISFKNKIPFLLITSDEEFVKKFSIQVNSNIIRTNDAFPINLDKISESDIQSLRQSLAINGLRLFAQPDSKRTYKNTTITDEKIINTFINNYCIFGNYMVSKQNAKDAFRQYLNVFHPHSKLSPLALCYALRNMGYSINSKKRINGIKNPIAVIVGMQINIHRLKYDIDNYVQNSNAEQEEDTSDIEYFLHRDEISNNEYY